VPQGDVLLLQHFLHLPCRITILMVILTKHDPPANTLYMYMHFSFYININTCDMHIFDWI
jgi:hypothetical protein